MEVNIKPTRKQREELDFLVKFFCNRTPLEEEINQYIQWTVSGTNKDETGIKSKNILFQAKRRLDMNIKMWTPDLRDGTLFVKELFEDFNHSYFKKIMRSVIKGIIKKKQFNGDRITFSIAFANRAWS